MAVRGRGLLNAIVVRPPAPDGPDALDLCHALMHAGLLAKPTHREHAHTQPRPPLAAAYATAYRPGGPLACSGLPSLMQSLGPGRGGGGGGGRREEERPRRLRAEERLRRRASACPQGGGDLAADLAAV